MTVPAAANTIGFSTADDAPPSSPWNWETDSESNLFVASQLARFVSNPGEMHFAAAVRVLSYLKQALIRARALLLAA